MMMSLSLDEACIQYPNVRSTEPSRCNFRISNPLSLEKGVGFRFGDNRNGDSIGESLVLRSGGASKI